VAPKFGTGEHLREPHNSVIPTGQEREARDQQTAPKVDQSRRARIPWQTVSVVVAILSLVVAIVFNAVQVQDSATAQDQSRQAAELQQLTQLDGLIRSSNGVFSMSSLAAVAEQKLYLQNHWEIPPRP
jgi:cytoskeletal protein RodZ